MDPAPQELQLRKAGVPLDHIHRDVGISGSIGTQGRQGWHQLDGRLAGGDTLVVVAIDRIGRTWQDIVRTICELRDRGVRIRSWPKRRPSGPSTWMPTKVAQRPSSGRCW